MEYRKLGNSDLDITTVGLGAWAIGGGAYAYGWGPQDDAQSVRTIHAAVDSGINWIDTAPVYGLGRSESVTGQALKDRRSSVVLSTKCGLIWDEPTREVTGHLKKESVFQECEASLKRLDTDYIDLYHIHWPRPEEQIEEAWEAVAQLIRDGKVRFGAVSNFSPEQMDRVSRIHPVTSLQPPYSMLERGIEDEILPYCRDHHIGITVYSPMQAGLLTGKLTRHRIEQLPDDDWRRRSRHMREPNLTANLELADALTEIAADYGKTPGQLAVAWTLRDPAVTAAIVGARKPEQAAQNAGASGWELSDIVLQRISKVLERHRQAIG